jgi:hypothetical protein
MNRVTLVTPALHIRASTELAFTGRKGQSTAQRTDASTIDGGRFLDSVLQVGVRAHVHRVGEHNLGLRVRGNAQEAKEYRKS